MNPGYISFIIPGRPFGQQRHRSRLMGRKVIQYDPPANKAFKRKVQELFRVAELLRGMPWALEGPMALNVEAIYPCTKAPRKRDPHPREWRQKKHDIDNVCKAIMDGLNTVAWNDDSQVVILGAQKYEVQQGGLPRTIVTVKKVLDTMLPPATLSV